MQEDNIREPDQYYMDTLLPQNNWNNNNRNQTVTIIRNKRGKPRAVSKKKANNNPDYNVTENGITEEEIMRISAMEYEREQNEKYREYTNTISDDEIIQKSIQEYDTSLEEEIMKLSIMEYEEQQKKIEILRQRQSVFENIKKQLDKLIKMDKNETYYAKIMEYISLYENGLDIIHIEASEHEKFLKIIKQIRMPENEKNKLNQYIVCL